MKTDNWRDFAYCKGRDTNDFYPDFAIKGAIKQVREMKLVCRKCSVSIECLQNALDNNEQFGIWGGLTPKERNNIRKSKSVPAKEVTIKVVKKNDNYEV